MKDAIMQIRTFLSSVLVGLLLLPAGAAFALYDAKPDEGLTKMQGEWSGKLTYRDYRNPEKMVSLPTRVFIALASPNELVLHYVFDDGPNKKVYSYDRMEFNYSSNSLTWVSGGKAAPAYKITSVSNSGTQQQINFERQETAHLARYVLQLSAKEFSLSKEEVAANGEASFRNRYEFKRKLPLD